MDGEGLMERRLLVSTGPGVPDRLNSCNFWRTSKLRDGPLDCFQPYFTKLRMQNVHSSHIVFLQHIGEIPTRCNDEVFEAQIEFIAETEYSGLTIERTG